MDSAQIQQEAQRLAAEYSALGIKAEVGDGGGSAFWPSGHYDLKIDLKTPYAVTLHPDSGVYLGGAADTVKLHDLVIATIKYFSDFNLVSIASNRNSWRLLGKTKTNRHLKIKIEAGSSWTTQYYISILARAITGGAFIEIHKELLQSHVDSTPNSQALAKIKEIATTIPAPSRGKRQPMVRLGQAHTFFQRDRFEVSNEQVYFRTATHLCRMTINQIVSILDTRALVPASNPAHNEVWFLCTGYLWEKVELNFVTNGDLWYLVLRGKVVNHQQRTDSLKVELSTLDQELIKYAITQFVKQAQS